MKNLTFSTITRILFLIAYSLFTFESDSFPITNFLWFTILLNIFLQYRYLKRRTDGTVILHEMFFPEFNYKDEREAILIAKAAKSAFTFILIFSPLTMLVHSLVVTIIGSIPITTFLIASIPIFGLLVYYFTYRYHYQK